MQYEYKRQVLDRFGGGEDPQDLNELGKNEWELVSVYLMSDDRTPIGIFKRPLMQIRKSQRIIKTTISKDNVVGKIVATANGFEIQNPEE